MCVGGGGWRRGPRARARGRGRPHASSPSPAAPFLKTRTAELARSSLRRREGAGSTRFPSRLVRRRGVAARAPGRAPPPPPLQVSRRAGRRHRRKPTVRGVVVVAILALRVGRALTRPPARGLVQRHTLVPVEEGAWRALAASVVVVVKDAAAWAGGGGEDVGSRAPPPTAASLSFLPSSYPSSRRSTSQ